MPGATSKKDERNVCGRERVRHPIDRFTTKEADIEHRGIDLELRHFLQRRCHRSDDGRFVSATGQRHFEIDREELIVLYDQHPGASLMGSNRNSPIKIALPLSSGWRKRFARRGRHFPYHGFGITTTLFAVVQKLCSAKFLKTSRLTMSSSGIGA